MASRGANLAEILTESFCERCGTRYTFESPARRSNPLGSLGTVGRGIRNFVVSPDQTIDEAFAVAKAETEQRTTAHQLEAFHQTFNFCLSCRQYTCGNCWNPIEGRCQSCAPMDEAEALPAGEIHDHSAIVAEAMAIAWAAPLPEAEAAEAPEAFDAPEAPWAEGMEPETAAALEPDQDDVSLPDFDVSARLADAFEPVFPAEATPEPEPEDLADLAPEPEIEAVAEPDLDMDVEDEPLAAADADTPDGPARSGPALSFPPGVSLDEEIAAYEVRVAAIATPAPVEAIEVPPPAVPEPAPLPPPAPAVSDQPAWPMAAERAAPAAARHPAPGSAQAFTPRFVAGPVPDLPAASPVALPESRTTGSCASCGLSLSATARFCRRCGTAQHLSA